MTRVANKIIVALDVPSKMEMAALLGQLCDQISFFKIGLQLYTVGGPEVVVAVSAMGRKVFLDLKLHDIPNTVARAVEAAGSFNVPMMTIHLSGGGEMIRAAVAARPENMSIFGVTVLTSASQDVLREIRVVGKVEDQVLRLAQLGVENGIDGIVASPQEIKPLRTEFGDRIRIVVPGIRPNWSKPGDQKRVMTPREAIDAGADYLVIGRPITAHPNPREAVEQILEEIGS